MRLSGSNELTINSVTIRATQLVDDQISTTLRQSSAIAKAAAINDFSEFTEVSAYVNETQRAASGGEIAGGTLNENDFVKINDIVSLGSPSSKMTRMRA